MSSRMVVLLLVVGLCVVGCVEEKKEGKPPGAKGDAADPKAESEGAPPATADTETDKSKGKEIKPEDMAAAAEVVAPSFVRVEFTLKYDKGQPPTVGYGNSYRSWRGGAEEYVKEERPLEMAGVLLAPLKVLTDDPMVHPRFLEKIEVVFGDETIPATILSVPKDRDAVILKLERPFAKAKPLKFDLKKKPPYLGVAYAFLDGTWTFTVSAFSPSPVYLNDRLGKHMSVLTRGVVLAKDGTAVAVPMKSDHPLGDSWKGSPLDWPVYSLDEMKKLLADMETMVEKRIPRVRLNFRSPKKGVGGRFGMMSGGAEATERNIVGVMLSDSLLLVPVSLTSKVTARLERITVFMPGDKQVNAKFACTLDDYGGFLATLDEPVPGVCKDYSGDIRDTRDKLHFYADVTIKGEERIAYFGRYRFTGFGVGRKRKIFPSSDTGDYIFTPEGQLVTVPMIFREKGESDSRYYRGSGGGGIIPVSHLVDIVKDPISFCDASNVPLTEEEENRLAWMGVMLQGLNPPLAREKGVSDLTNNGSTGAMVSYVFPDSPAARNGVEWGDILLRLHVEGEPAPVEIRVERSDTGTFRWDWLGQAQEAIFDRIPQPWPSAATALTRKLTALGFGKKYTAEFFVDGKVVKKKFKIVQGPAYYDSAKQNKSKSLGITVRSLTFEVRKYFTKTKEDPGVIISKIEPGSKGSISGLKPYEIITHVNDKPIMAAKEFGEAIKAGGELRLSVLRMTETRVVKVKLDPEKEDGKPDEKKPDEPAGQ